MSQLADSIIKGPLVLQTVPTEKTAALIYVPGLGWLEWVEVTGAGAFQGYRTLRCGALEFGTTVAPRPYEADLVGGLGSKTGQASIWAWAQQNGHAVTASAWTTKVFKFADVDANTFRFPDLRDVGPRFTGTNADTNQARAIGSYQADALQKITGTFGSVLNIQSSAIGAFALAASGNAAYPTGNSGDFNQFTFDSSRVTRSASETRGMNTAFAPRIHL